MCEGHEYDDALGFPRHTCRGPIEWNHTLINKAKYRGVKGKKLRAYFDQEINFSKVCRAFHAARGETTAFREFWQRRQARKYGVEAVRAFFANAPMRLKIIPRI